jgi:hypothetical protein
MSNRFAGCVVPYVVGGGLVPVLWPAHASLSAREFTLVGSDRAFMDGGTGGERVSVNRRGFPTPIGAGVTFRTLINQRLSGW